MENETKQKFIEEEKDAMKRLDSAIDRIEKGKAGDVAEFDYAICDIKHTIGCVVRMLHYVNPA